MVQKLGKVQSQEDMEPIEIVLHDNPVPIRVDKGGAVRVGPTRVTLDVVIGRFNNGASPEEIVSSFTTLQLADVYSVIGYYLKYKEEIDQLLHQHELEAEEIRHKIESYQNSPEFRARHEAQRASRNS
jgi:uncharacterized protein (DUF433 family)